MRDGRGQARLPVAAWWRVGCLASVLALAQTACGDDLPPGTSAPLDGEATDGAAQDAGDPTGGTTAPEDTFPGPLLDDAGTPGGTTCVPVTDTDPDVVHLALRLVELAGELRTPGLDLPSDCARGLFLAPANGPALVQLRGDQGNFDLPVDCRGRFRALVPPGRYRMLATLQWFDPTRGESFSWAEDLLPEPLELQASTTFTEPLSVPFTTLSGRVTFDGQARFAAAADPVAPGAPCLAMAVDERRTNGVLGTRGHFHADCTGSFTIRVPLGDYGLDLLGPSPGKERQLKLASGHWRLTPSPIAVQAATVVNLDVPLARLQGNITAPFPLPCAGSGVRLDLQSLAIGNIYGAPLCDGALDAWLSPGQYKATLVAQVEGGSARIVLPDLVTIEPSGATLVHEVVARRLTGQVRLDGAPAVHGPGMGNANLLLLGKRSNGFTAWVQPGAALTYSAWLAPDLYDLLIYASGTLPGGRHADNDFVEIASGMTPARADIELSTVPVAGEVTFGGQPAGSRCEGYTVSFQQPLMMGAVNVTPRCVDGRLRFATTIYAADYRVVVRRPNVQVETPIPVTRFSMPRLDLVADLKALDERPLRGLISVNGCVLRESAGQCGATYTVTLRDPRQGVAYTLPPAFQDQPFEDRVLPGSYKAGVRFSALCDSSPFAGLRGEIAAPGQVVVP